jgi:hypothetical protein
MRAMNAESRTTTDMVSMTGYDPARVVSVHCGRCTLTTTDMVSMTGYDPARRVTMLIVAGWTTGGKRPVVSSSALFLPKFSAGGLR